MSPLIIANSKEKGTGQSMTDPSSSRETAFSTPVLLVVFNRPDTTRKVFEVIRRARPSKLYVASDGPRAEVEGEARRVEESRKIATEVDWECEVNTLFREKNVGCRQGVSTAIDWFFQKEEEGIILEDDCVPHLSFFPYCRELLERYRDDEKVGLISGSSFQLGRKRSDYSYYFSRYPIIWGWAAWRRSWKLYDDRMTHWPEIRDGNWLEFKLGTRRAARYWTSCFDRTYREEIDSWGYRWVHSCWANNLLTIAPEVNMISNIGFAPDALHTRGSSPLASMEIHETPFPLRHPNFQIRHRDADSFIERTAYSRSLGTKLIHSFGSRLKKLARSQKRWEKT